MEQHIAPSWRRRAWHVAAAGGALALLPLGAAWAVPGASTAAPAAAGHSVVGHTVVGHTVVGHTLVGTVTFPLGSFSIDAQVPAGGAPSSSTGTFSATGSLVPSAAGGLLPVATQLAGFHFAGPVTCMDVRGGRVGLIYPLTDATGPVAAAFRGQAISITIQDNGPDAPEQVGFVGPAPLSSLTMCPALVAFLPVTAGHIAVDGR